VGGELAGDLDQLCSRSRRQTAFWLNEGVRHCSGAARSLGHREMNYRSKVFVIAWASAGPLGSASVAAQVSVDLENRYSNVGAIMVWRVDGSGTPLQLLGFVSGPLIRDRVMVTAGHFTGPAKALGELPPSLRFFASFNPTDAKDPKTWIPLIRLATHPSMPPARRRLSAIQPTKFWSLRWSRALPTLD
jgi:hypothetical protein